MKRIEWSSHMLIDEGMTASILFIIQKLINMNPGPNSTIIGHAIVRFQYLQERALNFVQWENAR
jgi:hypothetical protein